MELQIKELIKSKGFTMQEFADKLGIARVNLTKTINGNPTLETLEKIATALNVQIWELFTASTSGEINGFVEYRGTIYRIQSKDDLKRFYDIVNQ